MDERFTDSFCAATAGGAEGRYFTPLLINLRNGVRLAFFQTTSAQCVPFGWGQIVAFSLASLFISLFYDLYVIGLDGRFAWDGLPSALVHVPIVLFAAIALAHALGRKERVLLLWQVFLMITAAIDAVVYVTSIIAYDANLERVLGALQYHNSLAPTVWLSLACAKMAADFLIGSGARRLIVYAVAGLLLALPLAGIERDRSLWQQADQHALAMENSRELLYEDALYDQARILDREIGAVQPGRRGAIDIFFVGLAGYGYQDVFMKEVNAVNRMFKDHFQTQDKSIRLINNPKTLAEAPVASVTSLRASLRGIAHVMDKEEDILFLFLTSHGSRSHGVLLDLWPLKLQELAPTTLRALLDDFAIKNRVIVISACFSGGFIDSLKNANTLVISSSASDKTSFGCSNDADWTHFGKAYFDEGLRNTHSFVEAFERAVPVIAAREKREGYASSDPQISLGADIKKKLLELQRQ